MKLELLKNEWIRYWYLPVIIIVGFGLMLIPGSESEAVETTSMISDQEYVEMLEARVENMLLGVTGAGECKVTITLASGVQKEYVREDGSVLVVTDKYGNQSPVLAKENAPEIAGVMIASPAAEKVGVRNTIIESVSTLLDVGTNKICVVLKEGATYEN